MTQESTQLTRDFGLYFNILPSAEELNFEIWDNDSLNIVQCTQLFHQCLRELQEISASFVEIETFLILVLRHVIVQLTENSDRSVENFQYFDELILNTNKIHDLHKYYFHMIVNICNSDEYMMLNSVIKRKKNVFQNFSEKEKHDICFAVIYNYLEKPDNVKCFQQLSSVMNISTDIWIDCLCESCHYEQQEFIYFILQQICIEEIFIFSFQRYKTQLEEFMWYHDHSELFVLLYKIFSLCITKQYNLKQVFDCFEEHFSEEENPECMFLNLYAFFRLIKDLFVTVSNAIKNYYQILYCFEKIQNNYHDMLSSDTLYQQFLVYREEHVLICNTVKSTVLICSDVCDFYLMNFFKFYMESNQK
jgi:hypothetical protein